MTDAETAARVGLVGHLYLLDRLLPAVESIATIGIDSSLRAVQKMKRTHKLGVPEPLGHAIQIQLESSQRIIDHPARYADHPVRYEGARPPNERRQPQFRDAS